MDVVITYVDITERFKEQYSKYVKKELEENRFRSYGVLDLQINGIRKYMPYIKNIFVVVSEKEQVEGIDLSDAIIIEHKDIIPERFLPCFNSCAIEMFLWKIPGLDEEFIYFNDDIFVIDKIHPSKWFIKGKPVLFPKEHEIKEEENIFKKNCINSSRLAIDITGSDIKDKYLQAKEMYNRCLLNGFNALIVKCSDLCDNIDFLSFTEPDMRKELLEGLTEEQIAKLKDGKINEEVLKAAKQEGLELTDEQLSAISGGHCSDGAIYPNC